MNFSLQDFRSQLASLIGGGGNQAGSWNGISQTGMTTPTTENTSADWNPAGNQSASLLTPQNLSLGLSGLSSLANLFQGNRAFNLADDQFKYQKGVTNTNLNNSIKAYNNSLEDRLTARGVAQGDDTATTAAEIQRKRLTR